MKLRLPGPPPRNQLTRGLGPNRRAWWFQPPVLLGGSASLSLSVSLSDSLSLSSFPCLTKHREEEDVHLCECPLNVQVLAGPKFQTRFVKNLIIRLAYTWPSVSISCLVIDGFGSGGHKTNPADGGSFQQKGAWADVLKLLSTPGIEV